MYSLLIHIKVLFTFRKQMLTSDELEAFIKEIEAENEAEAEKKKPKKSS